MSKSASAGARSRARELLLQALYQLQLTGYDSRELLRQFHERPEYQRVDQPYFDELLRAVGDGFGPLRERLAAYADRPVEQLDPVETAILTVGVYELESRGDVPYRVVINEAVNLARRFGAEDGHKFVNAVLDRAVGELRPTAERRS